MCVCVGEAQTLSLGEQPGKSPGARPAYESEVNQEWVDRLEDELPFSELAVQRHYHNQAGFGEGWGKEGDLAVQCPQHYDFPHQKGSNTPKTESQQSTHDGSIKVQTLFSKLEPFGDTDTVWSSG